MKASEHDRGRDDEIAFGNTILSRGGALGLAHQVKDSLAIRHVGAPCIGQCQATARPVHQSRFQIRLQLGDFAAHISEWNTETAGGGGQAALFGRSDQNRHGFEAIHDC